MFFMTCLIAPLFFFHDMEPWQKIGYLLGSVLWLLNFFLIGSGTVAFIAFVVLFVSCIQIVVEHFPFRAG